MANLNKTRPAPTETLVRILRAPFFLISIAFSTMLVFFFFAWVSVGSWCEDALRWLGYRARPRWLPAALGLMTYVGLGIAGPAYLGAVILGWPGAVLGPVVALGAITILGRW